MAHPALSASNVAVLAARGSDAVLAVPADVSRLDDVKPAQTAHDGEWLPSGSSCVVGRDQY